MPKKWKKGNIGKVVIDNKDDFDALQVKHFNLMLDFCRIAVKTFQVAKWEPLNILEINQIVTHEIELEKAILSKPELIDLISRKIEKEYAEE